MDSNQQGTMANSAANGTTEQHGHHHPGSTTIGTIVVQGGPLQLVIAVLQVSLYLNLLFSS